MQRFARLLTVIIIITPVQRESSVCFTHNMEKNSLPTVFVVRVVNLMRVCLSVSELVRLSSVSKKENK